MHIRRTELLLAFLCICVTGLFSCNHIESPQKTAEAGSSVELAEDSVSPEVQKFLTGMHNYLLSGRLVEEIVQKPETVDPELLKRAGEVVRSAMIEFPRDERLPQYQRLIRQKQENPNAYYDDMAAVGNANLNDGEVVSNAAIELWRGKREKEALELLEKYLAANDSANSTVLGLKLAFLDSSQPEMGDAFAVELMAHEELLENGKIVVDLCSHFLLRNLTVKDALIQESNIRRAKNFIQRKCVLEDVSKGTEQYCESLCGVYGALEMWPEMQTLLERKDLPKGYYLSDSWCEQYCHSLLAQGKKEALEAFLDSQAERKNVTYKRTVMLRAFYSAAGFHVKALKVAMGLVNAVPDSLADRYEAVLILARLNKMGEGIELFEKVYDKLDAQCLNLLAELQAIAGKPEKACATMARVAELVEKSKGQEKLLENYYLKLAGYQEQAGRLEEMIATLKEAYEKFPDSHQICNAYGYTLADMNQELVLAHQLIDKAVKAQPDSIPYVDSLAWVYFREGMVSEALAEMRKIEEVMNKDYANDWEVFEHFGDILKANDLVEEAQAAWQKAARNAKGACLERIKAKLAGEAKK